MFKNSDANLFHSKNLLVETYCAAQSSVLYGIANYNPPATGNLYQSKDWRSPTYVFLFCWAPEVISKSKSPWGTESVTVYSLSYCIVCVYLCPIRTLSLLRVFKITLQIYSYFEKGCRKKCTRQSQKGLWVVLSSLFFKEIWKNGTWGHGNMFASAKGKHHK